MARVRNLRSYDAVSRDVAARWAFPLVPDANALPLASAGWGRPTYRSSRHFVYREQGVTAARTSVVGPDAVVGAGATVGEDAKVTASTLGRNARVGRGAAITGSYIGEGATIGDGAVIIASMVCDRAVVGAGARVGPGAIISFGVVVAPRAAPPPHARVSLIRPAPSSGGGDGAGSDSDVDSDAASSAAGVDGACDGAPPPDVVAAAEGAAAGRPPPAALGFDTAVVGDGGAGYAWPIPADAAVAGIPAPPAAATGGGGPADDDSSDDDAATAAAAAAAAAAADPDAHFMREVTETFLRCAAEGHEEDLAVLELNGLKLAEARTFADVGRALAVAVIGLAGSPPPRTRPEYRALYALADGGGGGGNAASALKDLARRSRAAIATWASLLSKFARDEDDQVELLLTLEEWCAGDGGCGAAFAPLFADLLKTLYDCDVVDEGALLAWADEKTGASDAERVFLDKAAPLIQWLREAESESEDDE